MKSIVVVGSINYDMTIGVDYFVKKGETILGNGISYSYGGKGANQACAIAKLGGSVKLLGAVGNDSYGVEMLEYLSKNKVDVSNVKKIENINTGLAVINVNKEGDNNIVVIPGANLLVDKEYIDNNMESIINSDTIVLQ
jgi:ribokinase